MAIRRRLLLLPPATRIDELLLLGRTCQAGTDLDLPSHHHPGAWELCWFAHGAADWWVAGSLHELSAGWCFLTRPGERHGSLTGLLEACDLHWLQLAHPPAGPLRQALARAPRAFRAPDLLPLWRDLWDETGREHPLAALAVRGALHRLFAAALAAHPAEPSPAIARALARAGEGAANVAVLARAAGMSRSVFHQRFRREIGDRPAAWLRRRRLRQAKQLLWTTDQAVTGIAHACGWATSQRFATAFRTATGLAPLAWRARRRALGAHS
jgi:AraC-like DNA-binding protein